MILDIDHTKQRTFDQDNLFFFFFVCSLWKVLRQKKSKTKSKTQNTRGGQKAASNNLILREQNKTQNTSKHREAKTKKMHEYAPVSTDYAPLVSHPPVYVDGPQYGYPMQTEAGEVYVVAEGAETLGGGDGYIDNESDPNLPHGIVMLFCVLSFFLSPLTMVISTTLLALIQCKQYNPHRNLRAISSDLILHLAVVTLWIIVAATLTIFVDTDAAFTFLVLLFYVPNILILLSSYARTKKLIDSSEVVYVTNAFI